MTNSYRIELPNIYHINAETAKEARDKLVEELTKSNPATFCTATFTDQDGNVVYLDSEDCCDSPDLYHDGGCMNCGAWMK